MAIWVIMDWQRRLNAFTQIGLVAIMNILEFILVPDLLLWDALMLCLLCSLSDWFTIVPLY
jgi:hypothetical protein